MAAPATTNPVPHKLPAKTSHASTPADYDLDLVFAIVRRGSLSVADLIKQATTEDGSGNWERWWAAIHWLCGYQCGDDHALQLDATRDDWNDETTVIASVAPRRSHRVARAHALYLDVETHCLKPALYDKIKAEFGYHWHAYLSRDGHIMLQQRQQQGHFNVDANIKRLMQRQDRVCLCRMAREVLGSNEPSTSDFCVQL